MSELSSSSWWGIAPTYCTAFHSDGSRLPPLLLAAVKCSERGSCRAGRTSSRAHGQAWAGSPWPAQFSVVPDLAGLGGQLSPVKAASGAEAPRCSTTRQSFTGSAFCLVRDRLG